MGVAGRRSVPFVRAGAAIACALIALAFPFVGPARAQPAAPPEIDAAAWLLLDARDGEQLAAHAPREQRSIASTTKLMTTYLALQELPLDRRLVVPPYSPAPAESVVGLVAGERLTLRDLLTAMLLPSANDAAETVALGVAPSVDAFVGRMNAAAADLGLKDTHYANPIGLDDLSNYSSAADLAKLTMTLLEDKRFRSIVSLPEADLNSGSVPRHVVTRNTLLLADPTVDGVKTGHTIDAGYVLVATARRHGVPLLSVVLGAPSESERDADAAQLLDYGYSLYKHERPVTEGEEVATAAVRYEDDPLALRARRGVGVEVRADQDLGTAVDAPEEVEGPIAKGDVLGRATVTLDGKVIGRVPLVAAGAVGAPGFVDRAGGPLVLAAIVIAVIVILLLVVLSVRRRTRRRLGAERSAEERMRSQQQRIRRRGEGGELE
ncbi:MAG: D-alanyl-D-alanine carboxypeptidase family protein [Solirubrobacterales bacterium]